MKNILVIKYLFLLIIFFTSCIKPSPFLPNGRKGIPDFEDEVYIINSLAETISIIDTKNLKIYNDVIETGMWPNWIEINNNKIYLVNSGDNDIYVIDEDTLNYLYSIELGVNKNPWIIKFYNGIGYTSNFVNNDISVIENNKVIKTISVGKAPEGIAIMNNKLYVANTYWNNSTFDFDEGKIYVINLENFNIENIIGVDKNPQAIIPFPSLNEVHIICSGKYGENEGKIDIINSISNKISKIIITGSSPSSFAVDYSKSLVYLAGGNKILSYNFITKSLVNNNLYHVNENDFLSGITFDSRNNYIFICNFSKNKIIVLNENNYKVIKVLTASDGPLLPFYYGE